MEIAAHGGIVSSIKSVEKNILSAGWINCFSLHLKDGIEQLNYGSWIMIDNWIFYFDIQFQFSNWRCD